MTIDRMIAELEKMKVIHGGECRVLHGSGECIEVVGYVPPSGGCDEHILIGE